MVSAFALLLFLLLFCISNDFYFVFFFSFHCILFLLLLLHSRNARTHRRAVSRFYFVVIMIIIEEQEKKTPQYNELRLRCLSSQGDDNESKQTDREAILWTENMSKNFIIISDKYHVGFCLVLTTLIFSDRIGNWYRMRTIPRENFCRSIDRMTSNNVGESVGSKIILGTRQNKAASLRRTPFPSKTCRL